MLAVSGTRTGYTETVWLARLTVLGRSRMTTHSPARTRAHFFPLLYRIVAGKRLPPRRKSTKLEPYHMTYLKLPFLQNWKSAKLEPYHMASLGLMILQKLELEPYRKASPGVAVRELTNWEVD